MHTYNLVFVLKYPNGTFFKFKISLITYVQIVEYTCIISAKFVENFTLFVALWCSLGEVKIYAAKIVCDIVL